MYHRKCDEVVAIYDVSSGIKESVQTKNILQELKTLTIELETCKNDKKENKKAVESEKEAICKEFLTMKQSIIGHLDSIEIDLKSNLRTIKKDNFIRLGDEETELSSLKGSVDHCISLLKACKEYGTDIQFFIELQKCIKRKSDIKTSLLKMKTVSLVFEPQETLSKFQDIIQTTGKIHVKKTDVVLAQVNDPIQLPFNTQTGTLKVFGSIDLKNCTGVSATPKLCSKVILS